MISRRGLFRTVLVPMVLFLAGCGANQPIDQNFARLAALVNTLAAALAKILPTIVSVAGGSSPLALQITGYIDELQKFAATVAASASTGAAASTVKQIENVVNALVQAASNLPLPPPIPSILMAASVVLPTLEALVGLLIPAAPRPRIASAPAAMTPAEAEAILTAAAAQK